MDVHTVNLDDISYVKRVGANTEFVYKHASCQESLMLELSFEEACKTLHACNDEKFVGITDKSAQEWFVNTDDINSIGIHEGKILIGFGCSQLVQVHQIWAATYHFLNSDKSKKMKVKPKKVFHKSEKYRKLYIMTLGPCAYE